MNDKYYNMIFNKPNKKYKTYSYEYSTLQSTNVYTVKVLRILFTS